MIRYNRHLIDSEPITVAVSGGIDSIAACHFLSRFKDVTIFHFNHRLSPQNDAMEEAIVAFSDKFGIARNIARNPHKYTGGSIEDFARRCRLEAMNQRHEHVILAHHLDDAIEGYCLNFLRGHTNHTPIPAKTTFEQCTVYRPFLLTSKREFHAYIHQHELWDFVVHDESNNDTKLQRNWIRHKMIPLINERYEGLEKVVRKKVLHEYNKYKSDAPRLKRRDC